MDLAAAESLAQDPSCVLKTLMVTIDGRPGCAVLASDRNLSMKRLAAAAGGKATDMIKPADAERMTGFKMGGISPLGPRKVVTTFVDVDAMTLA